jgi:hypothetical protein
MKDELLLSEMISMQDRIRTFSDGLLTINHVQPSDHGAYVCVIRTANGLEVRSEPAVITVRCK